MNGKDLTAVLVGSVGHGTMWIMHTEQIWFPMVGAYVKYLAPVYNLPDMRGPLAFLSLVYIGLRLGDLWNERNEIEESI